MGSFHAALALISGVGLVAAALGVAIGGGRPDAAVFSRWAERRRQRRALASLDDHLLRDIGITRAEAMGEARKPFWRE